MNTTITITIPEDLKQQADRAVKSGVFRSMTELVHTGIRRVLPEKKKSFQRLTVNGFTPEFEQEVLEAEKEPLDQSVEWDGKGSFVEFCLKHAK